MANKQLTIGVTGETGFVGKRLLTHNELNFILKPLQLRQTRPECIDFNGMDAIIHLAGKAHDMSAVDDRVYYDVNFNLTKQLADAAKAAGVPHFVYISTTKVYGDDIHEILNEESVCLPTDAYGKSKLQAEEYLLKLASKNFIVAIVRPPLVYGPEVKGNMLRLLELASRKIPLPFGNTRNARSMVFVDNLIALINTVVLQQAPGIFVAGDSRPIATDELISLMKAYLGSAGKLITIPFFLRKIIKKLKPSLYIRLFGSFVVNNAETRRILNFNPPYSTAHGIEQTANWFRNSKLKQRK